MPDEESINPVEVADINLEEFSADEEFDAAWDNDDYGESTKKTDEEDTEENTQDAEKDIEKEKEDDPAKEDKEEDVEGEKDKDKDEKDQELTAAERAEQRARDKFGKEGESELEDSVDKSEKDAEKEKEAEESLGTPYVPPSFDDVDSDPLGYLKKLASSTSDTSRREQFEEVLDQYPEIALLATTVAKDLAQRIVVPESLEAKLPEAIRQELDALKAARAENDELRKQQRSQAQLIADMAYFEELEALHPGARKEVRSKEFTEWLDNKASVGIKKLANTDDPEDGVAVIEAYTEFKAATAAKKADEEAKEKQEVTKAGLRGISAQAAKKSSVSQGEDKDDFAAGWNDEPPKRWQR